jgi:hypothetical protein
MGVRPLNGKLCVLLHENASWASPGQSSNAGGSKLAPLQFWIATEYNDVSVLP